MLEKMKIEELNIGNLITYNGLIVCIEEIKQTNKLYWILAKSLDGKKFVKSIIRSFEPILITDKLIDKLGGWELDTDNYPFGFVRYEKDLISIGNWNGNYFIHIDDEDRSTIGSGDIKYLHQWQNLVRIITGNALDLENIYNETI